MIIIFLVERQISSKKKLLSGNQSQKYKLLCYTYCTGEVMRKRSLLRCHISSHLNGGLWGVKPGGVEQSAGDQMKNESLNVSDTSRVEHRWNAQLIKFSLWYITWCVATKTYPGRHRIQWVIVLAPGALRLAARAPDPIVYVYTLYHVLIYILDLDYSVKTLGVSQRSLERDTKTMENIETQETLFRITHKCLGVWRLKRIRKFTFYTA